MLADSFDTETRYINVTTDICSWLCTVGSALLYKISKLVRTPGFIAFEK
jgi:hypothetical protein